MLSSLLGVVWWRWLRPRGPADLRRAGPTAVDGTIVRAARLASSLKSRADLRGAGPRRHRGVAGRPKSRATATLSRAGRGSFEDSCAHGELPAHCACAGKKKARALSKSATKVQNGARGCREVCPAKGQPRPEADQRQTPAAPCVRELGGRKQGEYRPTHAEGDCYVAREAEGPLVDDGGQRRQADAPAPQRYRPRRQPAVCLRPPERLRGAGNGFATVTRRSAKELRAARPRSSINDSGHLQRAREGTS